MSLNSIGTQIPIEVAKGGTNSAAALSNGVMIVSSAGAIIEGTPTVSGGALGAVTTFSMSSTLTNSSLNTTGGILQTNGSGVFSSSVTLPDGTLATTQGDYDKSTKLATTEYSDLAVGWNGYKERVLILPRDFIADNDATDDGWAFQDVSPGGVMTAHADQELYAFVPIPSWYKVTAYRVYGNASAQDVAIELSLYNCFTGVSTSKASGDTVSDGEISCTDFIGSENAGWVARIYCLSTTTSDTFYGGYLVIEPYT
jgi:hypothetical protein